MAVVALAACGGGAGDGPGDAPPEAADDTGGAGASGVIGRWRDTRPMVESVLEIAREDGALVLEQTFTLDGSTRRYDLVETGADQGRRFEVTGDEAGSAYWIVTPGGELQLYDALGFVATAQVD